MKLILKYIIIFFAIITSQKVLAAEQRGMLWTGFTLNGYFYKGSNWNYNVLNQARLSYTPNVLEQYLLRSAIYYKYQNWTFWGGYDFIPTRFPTSPGFFLEQRIWPQIQYSGNVLPHMNFTSRSRLEMRWRTNAHGEGLWFRQSLGVTYIKFNKYNIDVNIFDEMFFVLDHPVWAPRGVIDQNRAYIGLIFHLSRITALDVGYLNLYRPHSFPKQMDHIIFVAAEINFSKGGPTPTTIDNT